MEGVGGIDTHHAASSDKAFYLSFVVGSYNSVDISLARWHLAHPAIVHLAETAPRRL